jgi:uncharacterized membrane protein
LQIRIQLDGSGIALVIVYLSLSLSFSCTVTSKNEAVENPKIAPAEPVQEQTDKGEHKTLAFTRGVEFQGRGNEPGWSLEIGPDSIVFDTNYGNDHYELPTPAPEVNSGERKTTYRARGDGHELIVVLEGKECQDTMADETFETTVTVTLDGKSVNGCGTRLH